MNRESVSNVALPPPAVPLHKLREPLPEPVPPPVLPRAAIPTEGTVITPPVVPMENVPKGKKKERRMELAGLEAGDPRSTYHLIKLGFSNVVSIVPKLLRKYWWHILIVLVVWYALASFNPMRLSTQFPALTPVWFFIDGFLLYMVFITAAYNNFVAKAVYFTLIMRVGLPLIRRIRSEGLAKVVADFRKLVPGFKENWAKTGAVALSLVVGFAGVGAFVSNYLTRNNRVDKIAVSLALAIALMKALSDGPKSLPFMAGRVVMKDLFVLMLKPSPVRNHHIYLAVSGLSLGFLCSLPFAYLSKTTSDYIGYYTGIVAILAGLVLFFFEKEHRQGRQQ